MSEFVSPGSVVLLTLRVASLAGLLVPDRTLFDFRQRLNLPPQQRRQAPEG